jgi:ribosomal protein L29
LKSAPKIRRSNKITLDMKKEENKSILANIAILKKDMLMMRIKASSGETIVAKDYKNKRKEVARLFTQINKKQVAA